MIHYFDDTRPTNKFDKELTAYYEQNFTIDISFKWKNDTKVDVVKLEICNTDADFHNFSFDNAKICCGLVNGADNIYLLMMNFVENSEEQELNFKEEEKCKTIEFEPTCDLIIKKGCVLIVKRNVFKIDEDPTKSCTNIPVTNENPDSKDGSIIIGRRP